MFGIFKNKKEQSAENSSNGKLAACLSGKVIALSDVPDPVFSQKILGDGFAIEPTSNKVLSPCNGKIIDVTDTLHAYGIESADGAEILIHIGINTVEMKGEGFKSFVKVGDKVDVGTPLCEVDFEMLKSKGYPIVTPTIITNIDSFKNLNVTTGTATAGETVCATYQK